MGGTSYPRNIRNSRGSRARLLGNPRFRERPGRAVHDRMRRAMGRGSSCMAVVLPWKPDEAMSSLNDNCIPFKTTVHHSASAHHFGTQFLKESPLELLPWHRRSDSQVPYQRLNDCHAISMPRVTEPEPRSLFSLSRGIVATSISTAIAVLDTSSMVHLRSSQSFTPDGLRSAFSSNAHHNRSLRMQLRSVWYHRLIGDTEGPTLITGPA